MMELSLKSAHTDDSTSLGLCSTVQYVHADRITGFYDWNLEFESFKQIPIEPILGLHLDTSPNSYPITALKRNLS